MVLGMTIGAWTNGNAWVCSRPCLPNVARSFPSLSCTAGMLVFRTQISSGSTVPSPTNVMLAFRVQCGSTTEMKLRSAWSKWSPYGSFRVGAACPVKSAFIPIAGFARLENSVEDGPPADDWAVARDGMHTSAASRHAARSRTPADATHADIAVRSMERNLPGFFGIQGPARIRAGARACRGGDAAPWLTRREVLGVLRPGRSRRRGSP